MVRHFIGGNLPRQRGADAVAKRIARCQHADISSAQLGDGVHLGIERRRPCARFAGDGIADKRQVPLGAEHELGRRDAALGLRSRDRLDRPHRRRRS